LLKHIGEKPMFRWLYISPLHRYDVLLFAGPHNYGGLLARDGSTDSRQILSKWSWAEYLPRPLQDAFKVAVSHMIILHDPHSNASSSQDNNGTESRFEALARHMYMTLDDLLRVRARYEFPPLADHVDSITKDPALEFVKFACHVLLLDEESRPYIFRLRTNLLKKLDLNDCAPVAQFTAPPSFTLRNVCCNFCSHITDLDLLEDSELTAATEWRCSLCANTYNKRKIESMLVEIVERRSLTYQLQDLRCERCRIVAAANLTDHCSACSGRLQCSISPEDFQRSVQVFRRIALLQNFAWLREIVEWTIPAQ